MDTKSNYFHSKGPINITTPRQQSLKIQTTLKKRVMHSEKRVKVKNTKSEWSDTSDFSEGVLEMFKHDDMNNENSAKKEILGYTDADIDVKKKYRQYQQRKIINSNPKILDKLISG